MAKDFKHFTFLHVILGKSINVVKEKKKKKKTFTTRQYPI